jgi:putative effector of murein hydrolase LrgA (UPF0299 family)
MVILTISEWVANLFILSIALCLIGIGILIFAMISNLSVEWFKRKVKEYK